MRLFWRVTLPQILPAILSAAALVFIFCLLSFAIVLVLGGGPRYTTLEVEVYRLAKVSLDLKTGSALALIGAIISLVFLYAYIKLQQRSSFAEQLAEEAEKPRLAGMLGSVRGVLFLLYLLLMALVILAPIVTVVAYSFQLRSGCGLPRRPALFPGERTGASSLRRTTGCSRQPAGRGRRTGCAGTTPG